LEYGLEEQISARQGKFTSRHCASESDVMEYLYSPGKSDSNKKRKEKTNLIK